MHQYNDVILVHDRYHLHPVQPRSAHSAGLGSWPLFQNLVLFPKSPVPFSGAGSDDSTLGPGSALPAESHAAHSPDSLPKKVHQLPDRKHVVNAHKLKWPLKKRHGCVTDSLTSLPPL